MFFYFYFILSLVKFPFPLLGLDNKDSPQVSFMNFFFKVVAFNVMLCDFGGAMGRRCVVEVNYKYPLM